MTATKALVLGCSQYQVQALSVLAAHDVELFLVDRNRQSPGQDVAHHFAAIDIVDSSQILSWMNGKKLDAVLPMNDFGTESAAQIAQAKGLPGNSIASAIAMSDKEAMRCRWQQCGLPIPDFACFSEKSEAESACLQVGFPCVMKPTLSGGGGRGISVLRGAEDIAWAYDFAKPFARNGRLIVEEFISGVEYTVEAISTAGKHTILAVSSKSKPPIRTRVATNLEYTAELSSKAWAELIATICEALDAVEHRYGLSHTELIIEEGSGKLLLVEAGGRPGGGHIFHPIIEAVSSINGPLCQVAALSGQHQDLASISKRGAVYRFLQPEHGVLKSAANIEAAKGLHGVLDVAMVAKPGDVVGRLRDSFDRAGFIVTEGQTRSDAIQAANRAEALIELQVDRTDHEAQADGLFLERC